jgi:hypothetical protein
MNPCWETVLIHLQCLYPASSAQTRAWQDVSRPGSQTIDAVWNVSPPPNNDRYPGARPSIVVVEGLITGNGVHSVRAIHCDGLKPAVEHT